MKNWFYLLKREFKLFASNSVILAIFIGAPLLYGLLLGAVYKKGKVNHLPVLVIDLDATPMSNTIIEMIDDNEVIDGVIAYNQENLKSQIINNDYAAIITIPDRFEAQILQKRHPEIQVEINTANILTANYSAKAIQIILGTLNAGMEIEGIKKQGIPEVTAKEQYEMFGVNYARFFNSSANYMTFLWPGVLGTIIQQVFMLALALSFAREFEERTFHTEFMPKAKNLWNAMLLKSLPFWIMGVGIIFLLRMMFPLFQVPLEVDGFAMLSLLAIFVISVTFLGILFSIAIPNQLKATEFLMVIATPSFILSGFTWPLSQMPSFIVALADIIPLTHFLKALRKVMLYQAEISDIQSEINGLIILSVIFILLSYGLLKLKRYRFKKKSKLTA
ncbi:ABC transporter permease [Urechidicola vernalis]|uniref:ABC transporter permease n=1 Tax=Urechidicola vernalis TaxID=3075600 RepID=A0ABU2Y7Q8_9FLAO|nr:ABC transporter permease [Urechidicola sp. P050]MDT0554221.1 ABC transporter permease [Urechidicola sp. P050]